jgi:V/A-type H+-transporting ATPase subunit I
MIFGDAGYGSVLLGLALIFGLKSAQKTGKIPDLFLFLALMGVCTIVWGSLTGSWFAVSQDALPGVFKALILPPFKSELGTATVQLHIKLFCFILGITQLLLAHIKNFLKYFPKLAALGQLGWIMVELGCFLLVLGMVLDIKTLTWPVHIEDVFSVAFPLAGAGVGIFLIFSQQFGGNFFVNIGKSLANIIPTCLNAVSGFSDIVSYIRLFAVGLAGSAIAESFNGLSGFTSGEPLHIVGALMGVLVLIAGHGLNFAMNLLSVMVHGVRLNLLEYSGHLGNEWSGYKYAPFALRAKTRAE